MLPEDVMDKWLTEEYVYKRPRPGDIRQGEILKVDERGVVVDLGLKRDGFIPRTDVELLGEETSSSLKPGQEVRGCSGADLPTVWRVVRCSVEKL